MISMTMTNKVRCNKCVRFDAVFHVMSSAMWNNVGTGILLVDYLKVLLHTPSFCFSIYKRQAFLILNGQFTQKYLLLCCSKAIWLSSFHKYRLQLNSELWLELLFSITSPFVSRGRRFLQVWNDTMSKKCLFGGLKQCCYCLLKM